MDRHNRIRRDYKLTTITSWTRFQNVINRHCPNGVQVGGRYSFLFCATKDLARCGFSESFVKEILSKLNSQFEEPVDESAIDKAYCDGRRSVERE
jgi:hypothetical protein